MQVFLFFALIISLVAVIFALQNPEMTTITFFGKFTGSLALIVLVAMAAGALISFFASLPTNLKTRWALRQQRKKIGELETSLATARGQLEEAQKIINEANKPILPPAAPAEPPPAVESEPTPEEGPAAEV